MHVQFASLRITPVQSVSMYRIFLCLFSRPSVFMYFCISSSYLQFFLKLFITFWSRGFGLWLVAVFEICFGFLVQRVSLGYQVYLVYFVCFPIPCTNSCFLVALFLIMCFFPLLFSRIIRRPPDCVYSYPLLVLCWLYFSLFSFFCHTFLQICY